MMILDRLLRKVVRRGVLTLHHADGKTYPYGAPDPAFRDVTIRFNDKGVPWAIARNPALGAGEGYMNGRIDVLDGDVADLLALFMKNTQLEEDGPSRAGFGEWVGAWRNRIEQFNWASRSKRNVAHHYDLNDRLYDLFLDADRQYSCAYFTDPANSLEQAQADKKAHIVAKLALMPALEGRRLRVLDIGCGWGGMALYIHAKTGADVLGVTLSEEQLKVARARAQAAGVADHVRFELIDYRAVTGTFDRIVSVGMFEHVGPPHYRTFFRKCYDLLAPDGVMLLHTIGRLDGPGTTDAFTAKYIFPGGYAPALSEMIRATEAEKLIVADIETLRLHYALTLEEWSRRTIAARPEIEALYDARFYRMWRFYLAAAACGFRYGDQCNYQLQLIKRRDALPLTRDYLATNEQTLRAG